jgi:hypothetical protein
METMIGIGVLLARIGVFWVSFAVGVYYFTRTGREGMRLQRMKRNGDSSGRKAVAAPSSHHARASAELTSRQPSVPTSQANRSWRERDADLGGSRR